MRWGMTACLIEMENLGCARGGRTIFSGLTETVASGEALIVRGPNGVGKSSLLRLLAGVAAPVAGTLRRHVPVAWLGHENALKRDLSVRENLAFWAAFEEAPGAAGDGVAQALAAIGLPDLLDHPVRLLSQGQKRRVALARVMASTARLWVLDEPTVGLDDRAIALLAAGAARHLAQGGGIVAATHVDLALSPSRVLLLGAGQAPAGAGEGLGG